MAASPRPQRRLWRLALEAAALAVLFVVFVATTVTVSGASMEPTLQTGDRALVPRYETWLHRLGVGSFRQGDVVYFRSPVEDGPLCPVVCPRLIKRIVALEGDVVEMEAGELRVNGTVLPEPYLGADTRGSSSLPPTAVPAGHAFVLGDNRGPLGSVDSRRFGPLPLAAIEGRAAWVVWPPLRRDAHGAWTWNLRRLSLRVAGPTPG